MALQSLQPHYWKDVKRTAETRNYRLSIDGGIRGTGIAMWDSATWKKDKAEPILVASFIPPSSYGWIAAARHIMDRVNSALLGVSHPQNMDALYIEMPQYFGMANAGGEAVAARGDLQKLTFMTGMLASFGWHRDCKIRPYLVNSWKGQLSKKQTEDRIKRILPGLSEMTIADHGWDAVGIGLYAKGLFE